jgi:hypothetical protein
MLLADQKHQLCDFMKSQMPLRIGGGRLPLKIKNK